MMKLVDDTDDSPIKLSVINLLVILLANSEECHESCSMRGKHHFSKLERK